MIQGATKTEGNYRAIYLDSSSSLKDFSLDRKKYFRKYILNEVVEEKDNQAIKMGKLVETMLLEPHRFDELFYMSACATTPTAMMLDFVESLYRHTRDAIDETGTLTKNFEELSKLAYIESGYKIKYEAVLAKFIDSDNQVYYDELVKVRTNGLLVVTLDDVSKAEQIVEELKVNFVTKEILTRINSQRWTILDQHQVENYMVDEHPFKSMMDKATVDHQSRTIQIDDLKVVWAVETFYEEYYLYRRAYIQGYLYFKAAVHMTTDPKSEYFGYKALPTRFVVCDSTNYFNPLIYTMSYEDLQEAYEGFEHKGRKYPGVKEIIVNLKWAIENNVWNMSRENYLNNGVVNIKGV
jgi:hypothetical protein